MVRNRSPLAVVLVATLLVTAGCLGGSPGSTTSPTAEPTVTSTETPVGTGSFGYDLRLRNYADSETSVEVTVTYEETGEQVFSEGVSLAPGESSDYELSFVEAGNYTIETTVDGTTHEYVWEVERVPPSYQIIVTAEDGDVSYLASSA